MKKTLFIFAFGWVWCLSIIFSAALAIVAVIVALPSIMFEKIAENLEKIYYANFE